VVLAFDVTGWTTPDAGKRIAQSKEVLAALNKELQNQSKELQKKYFLGKAITQSDALKIAGKVGSAFAGGLFDAKKNELFERLDCAYRDIPLGVWIESLDTVQKVLYIIVPLIVVGSAGATAMYIARVGDELTSWAVPMIKFKKEFKVQNLGKISFGVSDLVFAPSKREIRGKTFGEFELNRLAIGLDLQAGALDGVFTDLGTAVKLKYIGSGAGSNLSLSISGAFDYNSSGNSVIGMKGSLTLKNERSRVPFDIDLSGYVNTSLNARSPTPEGGGFIMLKFDF
jgi:hypothetical protein